MATITVCDVCGCDKDVERMSFAVGKDHSDPLSQTEFMTYDLCPKHHRDVLNVVIKDISETYAINYATQAMIAREIKVMIEGK